MLDEERQTAGDTQPATEPGAEQPQVVAPVADVQASKPEVETVPPEKTISEKEWRGREAERDRREAELRQGLARTYLQQQVAQAEALEARAQAVDKQAVDRGEISDTDAQQRANARFQAWQQRMAGQMQQQQMQQQMATAQMVLQQADQFGRVLVAHDLAAKHGIDAKDLIGDKSLMTPEAMENKALRLALEKSKTSPETFDSGFTTGATTSIDKMSALEKVMLGLKQRKK